MITHSPATWLGRLAPDRAGSVSLPAIFLLLFLTGPLQAQPPADPSIELKKQLRGVLLQLRTAQTESANAMAATAAAEVKNKELTAKIDELGKTTAELTRRANADKNSATESIDKLNKTLADRDNRLILFQKALEEWKAGYKKAADVANQKEDERAALASEAIVLKRTVADRERKNISLFNTANEILDRYENYSLGKALSAREPFIGTTRVKVENQVQGYKDKILDQRIEAPAKQP